MMTVPREAWLRYLATVEPHRPSRALLIAERKLRTGGRLTGEESDALYDDLVAGLPAPPVGRNGLTDWGQAGAMVRAAGRARRWRERDPRHGWVHAVCLETQIEREEGKP